MTNIRDAKQDSRPQRFGWAPGSYISECVDCHAHFIGDKRAVLCADCAYAMPDTPTTPPPDRAPVTAELIGLAIRAGCNKAERHLTCSWPHCTCKHMPIAVEAGVEAALAAREAQKGKGNE